MKRLLHVAAAVALAGAAAMASTPTASAEVDTKGGSVSARITTAGPKSPQAFRVKATLDGRTARKLSNHAAKNRYPKGSSILVVCQASGSLTYKGSRVWDLTSDGLWVPDHYVATGSSGFTSSIDRCSVPKTFTTTATLDGRVVKRISNHAHRDRYRKGAQVRVVCQAYGGATYRGSYLWDRTAEGYWVPDYYLKTGTSGPVAGLPRCDMNKPAGTSAKRMPPSDLRFSSRGAAFVATFEGFSERPDEDPSGHCTIGFGHLIHYGACTSVDDAHWGTLSIARGEGLLWSDLQIFADGVRAALPRTPLTQQEFDALVAFTYNVGPGGLGSDSSVGKDLKAVPPNYGAVPNDLMKWVNEDREPSCGLHWRRFNEGSLFSSGSYAITRPACPYR